MISPSLWLVFAAAFVVAGLLNFARSARTSGPRRTTRVLLAISCVAWAASSLLLGTTGPAAGAVAAGVAVLIMVAAAAQGARQSQD